MAVLLRGANPAQQEVPTETQDGSTNAPSPASALPFVHYARKHPEPGPINASGVTFGQVYTPQDVPAIGYLRDMWLNVQAVGGTSTAAVVADPDAPFSAIQSLDFLDIGGQSIIETLGGYDLYLINKFGGYNWNPDIEAWPSFSAVNLGAAAGGGDFSFSLYLPFELNDLSGYGSLPNENAAAAYKFRLNLAPDGAVYSTPPTTLPTLNINTQIDVWTKPNQAGAPQEPVGLGSTAYWTKQTYNTVQGANTLELTGRKGNPIHTLIFIFRDSTGARYSIDSVQDFRYRVNSYDMIGPTPRIKLQDETFRSFGIPADEGVWPLSFRGDFNGHPAKDDTMLEYLPTSGATKLQLFCTLPASGSGGKLDVLTGDLIPQGSIPYAVA